MHYQALTKEVYRLYRPVLALEDVLPAPLRLRIEKILTAALAILFAASLGTLAVGASPAALALPFTPFLESVAYNIYGLFLIVLAIRFCFAALEAFHRSYYFRGLSLVLSERISDNQVPVSFEVATIVHAARGGDATDGFLESRYGQEIMLRAGVAPDAFWQFASSRAASSAKAAYTVPEAHSVTLPVYAGMLFDQDETFSNFLLTQQVTREDLVGAAGWVMRIERSARNRARWWSRDNLGRIEGLGKNWSYGETYLLERYGHEINDDPLYEAAKALVRPEDDEVEALEAVLARSRQSNALVVGNSIDGGKEAVAQLAYKIEQGEALPSLEHKRVFVIDIERMVSVMKEKAAVEKELLRVLDQSVAAGNIILVFEDFARTMQSLSGLSVDVVSLMAPYFNSPHIHVAATLTEGDLHAIAERNEALMQYFEVVRMHDIDAEGALMLLEQTALAEERRFGVVCTYRALRKVVESAEQYFPDGVMPDKAIDLLLELTPTAAEAGDEIIDANDVERLISEKTGVPMGAISPQEQKKLLAIEDVLHERVVGQERAVAEIGRALRRARAGAGNADRPIGTFLFLGPTGVGKTETAKALAFAMFNDEDAMHRLDMSEYQTPDALARLIGTPDGATGRLADMLREKQYGVLLLDEFEKTNPDVHDLFLQILDEGRFTDGSGKQVSARNLVIIATSNAAADRIWNLTEAGEDVSAMEAELVDEIIDRGIFKPELLNRFDRIVVFHPLEKEHLQQIALIKLGALARRVKEKGIELVVSDELAGLIAGAGYDPKFGARPMNRYLQDTVEQIIADRMIAGTLRPGMTLSLTPADLKQ